MIYGSGFEMMCEVARYSSFTRAAHALNISGAAVSKQVKLLEQRLGLLLFHRTTRTVTLTEAGKQLVDVLNRGRDEISTLLEELVEGQERPAGKLRVNAPMAFGERFLVGPIADYAHLYPDVVVDVEFEDKRIHLIEEEYDLIIRIGTLKDSGLIARRLCDFPTHICASPTFLERHGTPITLSDLKGLPAVIYTNSSTGLALNYCDPDGIEGSVNLTPAIYANSIGMLLESTLKGIGFAHLPAIFCGQHLKDGSLIALLPDHTSILDKGLYVIYPDRRYLPMKVRLFIELLEKRLQ